MHDKNLSDLDELLKKANEVMSSIISNILIINFAKILLLSFFQLL